MVADNPITNSLDVVVVSIVVVIIFVVVLVVVTAAATSAILLDFAVGISNGLHTMIHVQELGTATEFRRDDTTGIVLPQTRLETNGSGSMRRQVEDSHFLILLVTITSRSIRITDTSFGGITITFDLAIPSLVGTVLTVAVAKVVEITVLTILAVLSILVIVVATAATRASVCQVGLVRVGTVHESRNKSR